MGKAAVRALLRLVLQGENQGPSRPCLDHDATLILRRGTFRAFSKVKSGLDGEQKLTFDS